MLMCLKIIFKMQNPRLANRYAKSVLDLSVEQNQVDVVYNSMKLISAICKSNSDFVAVLRSPVIKADKKGKIIESVLENHIDSISKLFIKLLVSKGRETNLDEIAVAFIDQYNRMNGIHQLKLTTAAPIGDELKQDIANRIKESGQFKSIEVESIVDESIIGGFVLETEGKLIDVSILRDLKDIQKQFMNNAYVQNIR
jgi:F-type H+-transporting ATPase subunit delta